MTHSPEMQGLRALAVSAVFLYHADSGLLPSGFVGVDIFFVLSGFLIGRKLLTELDETGSIHPLEFTAARAKRLLPNSLLVLFATALAALFLLPPYRLGIIGADIQSSALIYSNFHFASNAIDYLQLDLPPSPVMHFWSLSIEEQFYLGLPVLLFALAKICRRNTVEIGIAVISAIALASFCLGLATLQKSQPEAFFETQNRLWQLAAGVISGWVAAHHARSMPNEAHAIITVGSLSLIGFSLFGLNETIDYPGFSALAPTAGTAGLLLTLLTGRKNVLNRILSSRMMQWVGDRSYSIYLWHWPFIVIAEANFPETQFAVWASAAASIVAASLAYRWVETPIRRARRWDYRITLPVASTFVAMIVCVGFVLVYTPLPPDAAERASAIKKAREDLGGGYSTKCHLDLQDTEYSDCVFGNTAASKTVFLFGDSHAAQWFDPLRAAAEGAGWKFISRTKTSCPAPSLTMWYPKKSAVYTQCDEWRRKVLQELRLHPPEVLIVANFSNYRGWIADDGAPATDERSIVMWRSALAEFLATIPQSTSVWLVRDNPSMATDFQSCLSYEDDCYRLRTQALDRLVDDAEIASESDRNVGVVDIINQVCGASVCPAMIGDQIAYRDTHHFTSSFALTFTDRFSSILKDYAPVAEMPALR